MPIATNVVAPDPFDTDASGVAASTACGTVAPSPSDIDTIEEVTVREREALPTDAVVIVAGGYIVAPPPSSDVWGLQVIAADTAVEDGSLVLFAALPLTEQPDPNRHEGDVVVQLRIEAVTPADCQTLVDVDVLLARDGIWRRVETWKGMDARWPHRIVPAVTRLMRCDANPVPEPSALAAANWRFGALRDMVSAGLLHEGETLLCLRPSTGARHEAHVIDGGIRLADGRWFDNPSGALTALGYQHRSGWTYWHRARDGVALSEIRLAPPQRGRRKQQREPQLRGMVADGTLHAGDELYFSQPRKGTVHRACVLADGRLGRRPGRCRAPRPSRRP